MTDIERAAFEGWVVGRLENVSPTTFLRRPTGEYFSAFIELRWEGWQARASRPVVVTNEMQTVLRAYHWFYKYPEFIPSYELHERMLADMAAARPLIDGFMETYDPRAALSPTPHEDGGTDR